MTKMKDLRDALVHELKDLHSAENQLTKALPKMAKKASHPDLKKAFEHHLGETEKQLDRLKQALDALDETTGRMKCEAMAGLLEEGEQLMNENAEDDVRDVLMIAAAQKVEHYEIASYGTAIAWCEALGLDKVQKLLEATMKEESAANEKLNKIAREVNRQAQPTS